MLRLAKLLLMVGGGLLIIDAGLMATGRSNPLFGWPLPCPVTLVILGLGIVLFAFSSKAFET